MRRALGWLVVVSIAAACGGNKGATDTVTPQAAPAARRGARHQANLVTADEIHAQGGTNLREILQGLRPAWFRVLPTRVTGSGVSADPVTLYLDGRRVGTAANLGDIPVVSVQMVRFYSASEAQGRFGMDNLAGAIEVTTAPPAR
jgi:hypothetical protein